MEHFGLRFHHLGLAVKHEDRAIAFLAGMGYTIGERLLDPEQNVHLRMCRAADAPDFVLAAGGTIASMAASGDRIVLVRVTNDDKDSWNLSAEETASRVKEEVERAAKVLGIAQVHSLGYRAGELGGVSPTEIRDRLLFYVRLVKPDVMLIPNPYAEYVEVLDRHYTGMAAEEARRVADVVRAYAKAAHIEVKATCTLCRASRRCPVHGEVSL